MSGSRAQPWVGVESDNLTGLTELNEESLLKSVKERYDGDLIYTDVGDILVAVNPFRSLPIYDQNWSQAYSRPDVSALAPHVFRSAARAYNALVQGKRNQVCVISGESGAGKTESAKFIMRQVMDMCKSAGLGLQLQQKIIQLNPILEAFGNARTALNDNSSRFGKYIQLVFEPNGRIVGAGLEQYLLEKSRVCVQGDKERNFHIFYYLYAGLAPEMIIQLHLKNPNEHRYLQGYENVMADCTSPESKLYFDSVIEGMKNIGFTDSEVHQVLAVLAAILLIGDIEFEGEDGAKVKNPDLVETVAGLLLLESSEDLCFALTTLRTTTRGETVDKQYSCSKAGDVRDAIAKALYSRMFHWIVARLNSYLQPAFSPDHLLIGILDIFGFENFEYNSFEQFCINLANEQLQQYFNHQIFAMEKVEYAREGLEGLVISYKDNKPVLDLFLTRPIGLLSLLDEQCRGFNGTEKAFVQRCRESFGKHANYVPDRGDALIFSIRHYAGDVRYEAEGFLERNKDSLPDPVVTSLKYSSIRLVRTLFTRHPNYSGSQLRHSFLAKNQRSVMRAMSKCKRPSMRKKQKPGAHKISTVSAHFRQSLDLLMERVFAASPHFVRCIKPNMEKRHSTFTNDFVLKQLRYTGMLEAVRVRREGFAYRPFFSDFFHHYRSLAYYFTDKTLKPCEVACRVILDKAGITGWKIGKSRVFLRYFHQERLQLALKEMEDKAIMIQTLYRGYSTRKWTRPLQETQKREKALVSSFLSTLKQHGQECFPKLLDLNRTDILLAVKRFGNKNKERESAAMEEEGSEKDRRKKRAKKAGILVPVFGEALAGESGLPVGELLRKRPKSGETGGGTREAESRDDSTNMGVGVELPHVHKGDPIPTPSVEEQPSNLVVYSHADDVSPAQASKSNLKHKGGKQLVGGVKILPQLHIFPTTESTSNQQSTTIVPTLETTVESSQGSSYTLQFGSDDGVSRPISSGSLSEPETPVQLHPTSGAGAVQKGGTHLVGGVKLLPDVQAFPQPKAPSKSSSKHVPVKQHPNTPSTSTIENSPPTNHNTLPTPSKDEKPQTDVLIMPEVATQRKPLNALQTTESSLDYSRSSQNRAATNNLVTTNSSSVPNLLEDHPNGISSKQAPLSARQGHLARSTEDLLQDHRGLSRRRKSNGPSSASSRTTLPTTNSPPQATKKDSGKGWFSFGRRRGAKKVKNLGSIGHTSDAVLKSPPPVGESDVLGFYPSLTCQTAQEMVSGQPRGTYVIYKEDSRIYSDHPRWDPQYQLVVSGGREVHIFSILCSHGSTGVNFYIEELDESSVHFPNLKSLLDYYKKTELTERLYLLLPKLVAGVSVMGVRLVKKGVTPKGRLGIRRKS